MRRRVKCCILLHIQFSTANQKIQIYFRYQSYTRRNLKKTVELWGRECMTSGKQCYQSPSFQPPTKRNEGSGDENDNVTFYLVNTHMRSKRDIKMGWLCMPGVPPAYS